MATSILTPKTLSDLVKVVAKHGKKAMLVSGIDPAADRIPAGKVMVDVAGIDALNEISDQKDRVIIGTGLNLGRVVREAIGENGLLRQAASLIANPLVRNRVTLAEALDPDSPYFDITTALALLESKVRIQGPTGRRTLPIPEFLDLATTGLKKGEMPVAVEFAKLRPGDRVGFFRLARMGGKGTVSAAIRMRLVRNVAVDPEIVVSSLSLIPLRSKAAERELAGKPASEEAIKRAATMAAEEIGAVGGKPNSYEQTLVEITVARTLRGIMEGSLNV